MDETDAFFTHTIVGAPFSLLMGRRMGSEAAQAAGRNTLDVETGRRYRQAILEAGGSRPAMESFKAFRGREPSLDALLRHQGMVSA